MTKAELRKIYADKRKALSAEEYELLNQQLLEQFKTLDLSAVNCLHIFLTIKSRNEPDTKPIIEWIKATYPQIKIVFPQTNFGNLSMQSFANDDHLHLIEKGSGIYEPFRGTLVNDKEIDMILIPLMAYDKKGCRVGYGLGFYDRFIEKCRADVQLLGLSFFDPVEKIADVNGFDKKMQRCVTSNGIHTF